MSYQVLARKWRPRTFREMVGQEHVLQALVNALDHDRLHHAYLFTGTRGVGKTTIGRILAKCLNCEVGVSSTPCNECSACIEINDGRFVDLIEVDAASRTKVEDTRELLENVQYVPSRGRYKVYLIDEVHMLSNSSFNALLKTLEEPPPHVKFLLATTDPQKLPVTILSRCLQFNLKNMNPERIVSHLQFVLDKEMVPFEEAGLWQLARSADGSMRDALSLTDQSIAFGNGKITDANVRTMLGAIDQSVVYKVLEALVAEDGKALIKAVDVLAEHASDYRAALAELITIFHRIAIAQALPEAVDNSQGDRQQIYEFAQKISAEDVQLYYQTALLGRRDLPLVPDPRSGFEMVLLRMLAFKPQGVIHLPSKPLKSQATAEPLTPRHPDSTVQAPVSHTESSTGEDQATAVPVTIGEEDTESIKKPKTATLMAETEQISIQSPGESEPLVASEFPSEPELEQSSPAKIMSSTPKATDANVIKTVDNVSIEVQSNNSSPKIPLAEFSSKHWPIVYAVINSSGLLQSTAANCQLVSSHIKNQRYQLTFILDQQQSTLYDQSHQQRLAELLSEYFAEPVQVTIRIGQVESETPAQIIIRQQQECQQRAERSIYQDPVVQELQTVFDAMVIEDSIAPVDGAK
ncbi:DNA polymerase III subunit gamma/tau [Candidatus Endobugula sertula]|uniref:DNA polymerase III subunit gamma/tau n=1 Tax=Candidatus Endobugula sertula TaxID=62101 RepID=A0A1D2QQ31_9GAMM|nr:DNA polymerase III subunit gamma/tau [Candidatus Endobugula sertula]